MKAWKESKKIQLAQRNIAKFASVLFIVRIIYLPISLKKTISK